MAYGSPSSKKTKGSALRGLFADPVDAEKRRKKEAEMRARTLRLLQMKKGKVSEKEIQRRLGQMAPALPRKNGAVDLKKAARLLGPKR